MIEFQEPAAAPAHYSQESNNDLIYMALIIRVSFESSCLSAPTDNDDEPT